MRNKLLYRLFLFFLLLAGIFLLVKLSPRLFNPENLSVDDFFHFWAGGNQNVQGKNPYDTQAIEQLYQQTGGTITHGKNPITLNPPWAISLLMLFGVFSYPIARMTWLLFSIGIIVLSSVLLWRIYAGTPRLRWLALVIICIFAPAISALEKGQLTPVVLIGVTCFLYFTAKQRNDWLAGILLAFALIKPQLVIVFWIALLFWVISQHRWRVILGLFISAAVLTLVSFVFNPHIIQQYIGVLQTYGMNEWATPTIGSYLRFFWLGLDKFWLQFVPAVLGGVWFVFYWYKHHTSWDWKDELPIIILVSLFTSPYSWTYDLVLLITMVIPAAIWLTVNPQKWVNIILVLFFLGINILDLVLHRYLDEFWFLWVTPAFFIWFLAVRWQARSKQARQNLMIADA